MRFDWLNRRREYGMFFVRLIIGFMVMIITFIAALVIAHRPGGYPPAALALIMLFSSIAVLVHGAGLPAVDNIVWRRRYASTQPAESPT